MDRFLPAYQFSEHHEVLVRASEAQVLASLRELDLAELRMTRVLLWLRSLPGILSGAAPQTRRTKLCELWQNEFRLLSSDGTGIVLGTIAKFWRARAQWPAEWSAFGPEKFIEFRDPGFAKAAISFTVRDVGDGCTRLATDTKVFCPTRRTRWAFSAYWLVIRPFSGFVRKQMLNRIKAKAETAAIDHVG